jgi:anti-sigma factor RsiW
MSCSSVDLKAYFLGELAPAERAPVEKHLDACQECREDLERLNATQVALMSLADEEVPQRIAFVSDKVFEPRWWQTIWHSGPVMGFASASVLAVAILVHAFTWPGAATVNPANTARIEQRVQAEVNARLDAAVTKAVTDVESRQDQKISTVLAAAEQRFDSQYRRDLADARQTAAYYQERMARLMVASNDAARSGQ